MRVLFIEGPNEAQVVDVPDGRRTWEIIKPSSRMIGVYDIRAAVAADLPKIETAHYKIHEVMLRCNGERDFIVHVGMKPDNYTQPAMAYFRYTAARLYS